MSDNDELDRRQRYSGQTELAVRSAFSERAAELDPSSIARLRAIDYRPRLGVAQRIRRSLASLVLRQPPH